MSKDLVYRLRKRAEIRRLISIETKLKELEELEYELTELAPDESATVNGGSANGVTLMYANEVNAVLEQYGRQEAKLIAALMEAVAGLQFYATPWGKEHGYAEPTNEAIQNVLNEKRTTAIAALARIENILNGEQK